jgi:hypothetical protein
MGTIRFGEHSLDNSLAKYGFHRDDITDVFMTHLHLTIAVEVYNGTKKNGYEPAFKNAKFWTNENHWDGQQNQTLERNFVLV